MCDQNLSVAWLLSDDSIILQVASIVHSSIQPLHMLAVLVRSNYFDLKCLDSHNAQTFWIFYTYFSTERYGENVWCRIKTVGSIYH